MQLSLVCQKVFTSRLINNKETKRGVISLSFPFCLLAIMPIYSYSHVILGQIKPQIVWSVTSHNLGFTS